MVNMTGVYCETLPFSNRKKKEQNKTYNREHRDIDRLDRRASTNDALLNFRSRIGCKTTLEESDREPIGRLEGSGLCRGCKNIRVGVVRILVQQGLVPDGKATTDLVEVGVSLDREEVTPCRGVQCITWLIPKKNVEEGRRCD
jgi:hypothetical protein